MSTYDVYRPPGFGTVSPYLFTKDAGPYIEFLKEAFDGKVLSTSMRGEVIANCIVQIGESCIMISEAPESFEGMSTAFYLYVSDVDASFAKAIAAGCETVYEPDDMDYQDRQGGVKDPRGNYWWVSRRLVEKPYQDS